MAHEYAQHIAEAIDSFLTGDDWKYQFDADKGLFDMGISVKGQLSSCRLKIRVNEDHYLVYACISMQADEASRMKVCDFITRANYGLRNGNFELDLRDGEIRYKSYVDCGEDGYALPDPAIIKKSIYIPAQMMQRYGDGLLAVMYGFQEPEAAIQEIEG